MSGVTREVIEHHFALCPNTRPMKQKACKQAPEKQAFIIKEVEKLKATDIIREVAHPTWLSNGVVVPKPYIFISCQHMNNCSLEEIRYQTLIFFKKNWQKNNYSEETKGPAP